MRLASGLTGWELNVMTEHEATQKTQEESQRLVQLFVEQLDVDEDLAAVLVQEGFTSLEEIAYVPVQELADMEDFDEDLANALRERARDRLLTQAIASENEGTTPAEDLVTLEGMTDELAQLLAQNGVTTREELAEQSISDLIEIEGIDAERAGALIMKAREHWFN